MRYIYLRFVLIIFIVFNYIETYNKLFTEKNLSGIFGGTGQLSPTYNRVEYISFSSLYFAVVTLYSIGLVYLVLGIYQIDKKYIETEDLESSVINLSHLFNKKIEKSLLQSKKLIKISSCIMIIISFIGSFLLFSDWSFRLVLSQQLGVFVLSYWCVDLLSSVFKGGLQLKQETELTI